jgi:hypothetical protein
VAEASRRRHTAIWAGAAIVLIGAGVAAAILLSSGGGSADTTVLVRDQSTTVTETNTTTEVSTIDSTTESTEAPLADSVEAGRYVQAGTFRTVSHAELEQERLAAAGVDVQIVSSDGAEEFYPGLQVLLGGPFEAGSQEETSMVKELHGNGVPSAFAKDLTPALEIGAPDEIAGSWSGELDRSSGEHPNLEGPLPVNLELDSDGSSGTLVFEDDDGCREELTLDETTTTTLSYEQSRPCVASGDLFVRPAGGELMLSLLPLDTDVLVLGSLSPG